MRIILLTRRQDPVFRMDNIAPAVTIALTVALTMRVSLRPGSLMMTT
ncbi:hypothetical protein HMPREF3197_05461 [Klebsiella pneumoniae]|nr:hypothetical protein HMPREF3197_05461 [Klebsiella pneumoniae]